MNLNLLGIVFINLVSINNCTINNEPVAYSRWLGGRNNSHSTINTLINQLDNFNSRFANNEKNLINVFQAQLTETADDILGCVTSTLQSCPKDFKCALHTIGLYKKPALEYWQNKCENNNIIITNWFKYNINKLNINNNSYYRVPDRNINVLLIDFYNTYLVLDNNIFQTSIKKNIILGQGCTNFDFDDKSNWMSNIVNCSKYELYFNEMTIIGIHDAATYTIYNNSKAISQIYLKDICEKNPNHCNLITNIAKNPVRSFAATQDSYNFYDMLNNGIRYLDLRIIPVSQKTKLIIPNNQEINSIQDIDIYFSHNYVLLNLGLQEGLLQIKSFISDHPQEVILLYFSHYDGGIYNNNQFSSILPYFNKKLINYIKNTLDNHLIKNCYGNYYNKVPSIQTIYKNNNNKGGVLILYKTDNNLNIICPKNINCQTNIFWNAGGSS